MQLLPQGRCYSDSTEYSKSLIRGYGLTAPIYAVSNGIDLARYEPKQNDREAFRKKFGLKDDDKVVISVGLYESEIVNERHFENPNSAAAYKASLPTGLIAVIVEV